MPQALFGYSCMLCINKAYTAGLNAGDIISRVVAQEIYGYGIRNSFGIRFDPVTGKLWDTGNDKDVYKYTHQRFL